MKRNTTEEIHFYLNVTGWIIVAVCFLLMIHRIFT